KMAHAIEVREHERTVLIAELDHRVKNMLAVVQSLSMQSFKGAGMAEQRRAFADRLVALAAAHDLLKREAWQSVDLGDLVRAALAPFRVDRADRIVIDGPPARLNADIAVIFTMAVHELATNAVKYGALSSARGRVEIAWSIEPGPAGTLLR